MARRKRKRRVARARSRAPKRSRRRKSKGMNFMKVFLPAAAYGAARERVSNFLLPVSSKIPLGSVADEAAMLAVSWFAAKKGSGMLAKAGMAGMTIESARIGEAIASGEAFNFFGAKKSESSGGGATVF